MRIQSFVQTPFVSHDGKNRLTVEVADYDYCNPYTAAILIGGETVWQQRIFAFSFAADVPCVSERTACVVRLTPFEDLPVERVYGLEPPKHWRIPLLYSSHEDLGYCAYIEKLHRECYEYLLAAMKLCEQHDGFRYMIEHVWWLDAFDAYASEEEKARLRALFAGKRMELNAIQSGVNTPCGGGETLVRGLYPAMTKKAKAYDIEPQTAFYVDMSGVTWSAVDAYAGMGIRYMGVFVNPFRNCAQKPFPPLFRWESMSGEARVLFWYQRSYRPLGLDKIWCDTLRQYPEGAFPFDDTKARLTEQWFTKKIADLDDYPPDILPISFYDDREYPTTMLLTVCDEMNKRWKWPHFYMEVPSVFLKEIEERFGDGLPVVRGDIPNAWSDMAAEPRLIAKMRSVERMTAEAEMLDSLLAAAGEGKGLCSKNVFRRAYWNINNFAEHCWASSSKHPQAMHRHNVNKVKREPIETSFRELSALLEGLRKAPEDGSLSFVNLIPQGFSGGLRLRAGTLVPKGLAYQVCESGEVLTEPATFEGVQIKRFEAVPATAKEREIPDSLLETPFYRVLVNRETRQIDSIFDKTSGKELLDRDAPYAFGEFIYWYTENKYRPEAEYETPKRTALHILEGDAAFRVVTEGYEEQSAAVIHTVLTFYKHERNIDVEISYKDATGLMGDFYDRYKKNFFFAFPFSVSRPRFYTALPVGERSENDDVVCINARDFTVAQSYVTAENEEGGVAVFSRDAMVFHLGKIKYNRFSSEFAEDKSHFYLYACSNRNNNLLFTKPEDCRASFFLSILPYEGSHRAVLPAWNEAKTHPPLIADSSLRENTWMTVKTPNVRLLVCKIAEEDDSALILRFAETQGLKTDAVCSLHFPISGAVRCDHAEHERFPLTVTEEGVHFSVGAYALATVKVRLPAGVEREGETIA